MIGFCLHLSPLRSISMSRVYMQSKLGVLKLVRENGLEPSGCRPNTSSIWSNTHRLPEVIELFGLARGTQVAWVQSERLMVLQQPQVYKSPRRRNGSLTGTNLTGAPCLVRPQSLVPLTGPPRQRL